MARPATWVRSPLTGRPYGKTPKIVIGCVGAAHQGRPFPGRKTVRPGMGLPGDILPLAKILVDPYGIHIGWLVPNRRGLPRPAKPCRLVSPSRATSIGQPSPWKYSLRYKATIYKKMGCSRQPIFLISFLLFLSSQPCCGCAVHAAAFRPPRWVPGTSGRWHSGISGKQSRHGWTAVWP